MTTAFYSSLLRASIRVSAPANLVFLGVLLGAFVGILCQPLPLRAASLTEPLSGGGLPGGPPSVGSFLPATPSPQPAAPPAPTTPAPSQGADPAKPARIENPAPIILSVGDLADLCAGKPAGSDGAANRNICLGFTLGVIAVAERQQASGGVKLFCTPKPTFDLGDTIGQFARLAQAQQSIRSAPVVDGLAQFLQLRFPCK